HDGTWRSLVARTLGVREVAGSNPVVPTKVKRLSASAESLFRSQILSAETVWVNSHFPALRAHRFGLARRLVEAAAPEASCVSINEPARVSTHIAPYSGWSPQEIPATL